MHILVRTYLYTFKPSYSDQKKTRIENDTAKTPTLITIYKPLRNSGNISRIKNNPIKIHQLVQKHMRLKNPI